MSSISIDVINIYIYLILIYFIYKILFNYLYKEIDILKYYIFNKNKGNKINLSSSIIYFHFFIHIN